MSGLGERVVWQLFHLGGHEVGEVVAEGAEVLPGLHQHEVDAFELGALLVGEVEAGDAGLHAVEGGLLEGVVRVGAVWRLAWFA